MGIEKLLIDIALGDGYITRPKSINGNCCLVVKHSTKQMNYLLHKRALLEAHGISCHLNAYMDPNGFGTAYFITGKKPIITKIRHMLYSDGKKKHLTPEIMNYFDERTLAIFFQDDGAREHTKWHHSLQEKYAVKPYINSFILNVQDFDKDSIDRLIAKLNVWDIESRLVNRNGSAICISKKDSKLKFVDLIMPHMCELMKYKIDAPVCFHGRL